MEALLEKEKIETTVEEIPQKKKKSAYWKTAAVIFSVTVILALCSFITPFCDWYANNLYIYLCDGLTYLTAYLPFCLGEMMMYLGVAMVIFSVIFLL